MRPLNEQLIKQLLKLHEAVNTACPIYPVEYKHSVCLTDNSFLIEWPKELVELSEAYFKLYENCKSKLTRWKEIEPTHWTKKLIVQDRMTDSWKAPKADDENLASFRDIGGAIPFMTRHGRWYYHTSYIGMIEASIEDPTYQVCLPVNGQSISPDLRTLCAYDGQVITAAVIDMPLRLYT